jgi:hypothetical protein
MQHDRGQIRLILELEPIILGMALFHMEYLSTMPYLKMFGTFISL